MLCTSLYAQQIDSNSTIIEDGYIEDMRYTIAGEVALNNDYEKFSVNPGTGLVKLSPNTALNIRFTASYRFVSGGFEIAPNFIPGNNDDSIKGPTHSFSLGGAILLPHWYIEGGLFQVQGYYLENTNAFIPQNPGDPFIQFPDLFYLGYKVYVGWSSNSRFSYKSLLTQTQRQLKSAGTFLPQLEHSTYIIDDRSNTQNKQSSDNFEFNLGPGYMYNWVLPKNFYISGGGVASLGFLHSKIKTQVGSESYQIIQENLIYSWELRGGVGHNGKRFYSGLYARYSGKEFDQQNTSAHNTVSQVNFHFFVGYRFKAPKFIRKTFDWAESKFPNK